MTLKDTDNVKKIQEGLFDNVNILTTNAKPKKASAIKSYDVNDGIA